MSMITMIVHNITPGVAYDFAQENDVLSSDNEDASRNITVGIANIYPLDRILQHQVGYCGEESG